MNPSSNSYMPRKCSKVAIWKEKRAYFVILYVHKYSVANILGSIKFWNELHVILYMHHSILIETILSFLPNPVKHLVPFAWPAGSTTFLQEMI